MYSGRGERSITGGPVYGRDPLATSVRMIAGEDIRALGFTADWYILARAASFVALPADWSITITFKFATFIEADG